MTASAITLIGMPGAGKTTLGRLLAARLNRHFVDTDQLLESQFRLTLQDILEREGALGLRQLEAEVALQMPLDNRVIATGGSMVYSQAAMERLQQQTFCVYLWIDLPTLESRLGNLQQRGFASPGLSLAEVLAERQPLYERYAQAQLSVVGKTVDESLTELLKILNAG